LPETLGFVIPWFGKEASGGAEAECRATARALADRGVPVEILTTCALSHAAEWADHHPAGVTEEDGLRVRRFRVRPRDQDRFGPYNWRLHHGYALTPREERDFVAHSIHSEDLYAYLASERERYWYAFIPYCFGTTWEGALVAPERSVLIPCLHDEPFAYLSATSRTLAAVRAVCFHVRAERALAEAILGAAPETFCLVGEGVDTDTLPGDPERFRQKYRIDSPFLLYVGRKVPEKNVPMLLEYFARYRLTHRRNHPLKLLLIGPDTLPIPRRLLKDILDLGFVSAQDRQDAYAGTVALCQPSRLESFSLVLMEAWLGGAPVLVDARCPVTREHCLRSNGGLPFDEYAEFEEAVDLLLDDPALCRRLVENGRAYVRANFMWDRVVANYLDVFRRLGARFG
jgi:glycosyltransferase involved in cell wall biosynthesis